ncbi:hypothetical protein UVI_02046370 [Ustilaginoidea virens]|uniref:Uncharacterized protein n=1 Tax=Ustilaginoidea virens TaxID=1159556 RepID=A0A1B5L0K5_USTVR|nr:hypothetical protein UVI_02046370 [Ustilaginoidea virens]
MTFAPSTRAEMCRRFILPILGEYSDAGYHEPNDKLKYSLRQNAQFYASLLGASFLGLLYVFIAYRPSFSSLKGLIMTLAYCWGLVLAIYLMGHGLVSIPRRMIRKASISGRLRRLQTRAPKVHEHMEDALITLEEVEGQVAELSRRKTGTSLNFQEWIEELQDVANIGHGRFAPIAGGSSATSNRGVPNFITEKYLAELSRKLVRARHTRTRYVNEWIQLVQEAGKLQAILDSAGPKQLDLEASSTHARTWDPSRLLNPHARYLCFFYLVPFSHLACGFFLALASACIVWSELVRYTFPRLSIVRISVVHHWVREKPEVGFAGQVVSAFWICYMCAATFVSMTEVKVWRGRALVKRNTSYESAFWYSMQVAKLTIPLSYNFMTFLSKEVYEKTIFYKFLGQLIENTAPGRWFDDLFPIVVLFPVVATLFGLYGKVKRVFFGIDVLGDSDENAPTDGTGSWRAGRDLLERELRGTATYRRRGDTISRLGLSNGRSTPTLSVPAILEPTQSPARNPVSAADHGRRAHLPRGVYMAADEAPQDENMFQILGHRMKNTIDTMEAPRWLQHVGQGIRLPKWMGGETDGSAGSAQGSSTVRRWFGGEGRVRL